MPSLPEPRELPPIQPPVNKRLDSWKEIAAHFGRNERTVRRWEQTEHLPVHRHLHEKRGTVYAYSAELDAWARRRAGLEKQASRPSGGKRRLVWVGAFAGLLAVAAVTIWRVT